MESDTGDSSPSPDQVLVKYIVREIKRRIDASDITFYFPLRVAIYKRSEGPPDETPLSLFFDKPPWTGDDLRFDKARRTTNFDVTPSGVFLRQDKWNRDILRDRTTLFHKYLSTELFKALEIEGEKIRIKIKKKFRRHGTLLRFMYPKIQFLIVDKMN